MPFGSRTGHSIVAGNMCAPASTVTRAVCAARMRRGDFDDALRRQSECRARRPAVRCSRTCRSGACIRPFGGAESRVDRAHGVGMSATVCIANGTCASSAAHGRSRRWAAVGPRPRQQLHRIQTDADEQIALVDHRLLDARVREHAGEPRVIVRHDALAPCRSPSPGTRRRSQKRADGAGVLRRGARQGRRAAAACAIAPGSASSDVQVRGRGRSPATARMLAARILSDRQASRAESTPPWTIEVHRARASDGCQPQRVGER